MDFDFNYFIRAFKHYADFNGRDSRRQYWMYILFNILVISLPLNLIGYAFLDNKQVTMILSFVSVAISLAIIIPNASITTRRLHDVGKSGWMQLVAIVPLIGIIYLIILLSRKGDEGENIYGPAPL